MVRKESGGRVIENDLESCSMFELGAGSLTSRQPMDFERSISITLTLGKDNDLMASEIPKRNQGGPSWRESARLVGRGSSIGSSRISGDRGPLVAASQRGPSDRQLRCSESRRRRCRSPCWLVRGGTGASGRDRVAPRRSRKSRHSCP